MNQELRKKNTKEINHNSLFFIRNSTLGLTLVELLLVLAIMTTVSLLATPFYARFFTQNSLVSTQDQLTSSLRKAHIYSMMGKQNGGTWGIHYASNTITLFQGNSYAARNPALDETYSVYGNISITGLPDIVFTHATGIPSTTLNVSITGNNQTKNVTVNGQGVVSKQ